MRDRKTAGGVPGTVRFTASRRERFLEVLRQTGNVTAAAAEIGMDRGHMIWRRLRDPALDKDWIAALVEASARLAGRSSSWAGLADGDHETIRRGPGGRLQIVARGAHRWTAKIEDRFIAVLRQTGNVEAAARAIGFDATSIHNRRRKWPAFARKWEDALEDAAASLEFRLATLGNNVGFGLGEELETPAGDEPAAAAPAPEPFDPRFALQYLKWRAKKKEGRGRRGVPATKRPSIEEVTDGIVRRIEAIRRHRAKRQGKDGSGEGAAGADPDGGSASGPSSPLGADPPPAPSLKGRGS